MKHPSYGRLAAALAALLLAAALSGCASAQPEKQAVALCLAIDRLPDGQVRLSLQTPVSKGGMEGESADAPGYTLLAADGATFDEALALLHQALPYPPSFAQVRLVAVGLSYAQSDGLHELVLRLDELPGMRPTACVALCLGEGREYLQKQKPDMGLLLSKHLDERLMHLRELSLIPLEDLAALARCVRAGETPLRVPLCALNREILAEQEKKKQQQQSGGGSSGGGEANAAAFAPADAYWSDPAARSALAGSLPHQSDNPAEMYGAAVCATDGVLCLLTGRETQVLLALRGQRVECAVDSAGRSVWALLNGCERAVRLPSDGPMTLSARLRARFFWSEGGTPTDDPLPADGWEARDAMQTLREDADALLRKLTPLGLDGAGFAREAARCFATEQALVAYGFMARLADAETSVE